MSDDNGRAILDTRTVYFLVGKGLMGGHPAFIEDLLLSNAGANGRTYPYETARATWAWLESEGGLGLSAEDAVKLVSSLPRVLSRGVETLRAKLRLLRTYGLNPVNVLTKTPKSVSSLSLESLEEKLVFFRSALGLEVAALETYSRFLESSLDDNLRPRIALMLQLGELPPLPSLDGKSVQGGHLLTILKKTPAEFAEYLQTRDHPTIKSLAGFVRAAKSPKLLAAAKAWEATQTI